MESLGINLGIIVVQIINFGLLVFVLNKFLYKPILAAIKAKRNEVAEINKLKEDFEKESIEEKNKSENIIKEAEKEKSKTIEEAKAAMLLQKKQILEKAQKEAKEILARAKLEIEADRKTLAKDYEKDVIDAAFEISKRFISKTARKDVEALYKELDILKHKVVKD